MVKDGNVFCDKCGKRIGPGETVCPDCGSPVSFSSVPKVSYSNLCNTLSLVVLVLGIIGSIYLAYKFGVKIDADYHAWSKTYDYNTVRDVGSTIAIFVSGAFGTIILYAILSTLGDIKTKLDTLG